MTYFAEIDQDKKVRRVIVADQKFIESKAVGDGKNWTETDTAGVVGKNYAGIGYTYDEISGSFVPPKPFASWILDAKTYTWKAPKEEPVLINDERMQKWDEQKGDWEIKATVITT